MTTEDRRTNKTTPWGYVVCTDSFLSGWGRANGGRSLYALAVSDHKEAEVVLANAQARTDMRRARINKNLPRLRRGDHLAVVDRDEAGRWYEPHGFCNLRAEY